jgi:hypothetical protein
LDFLFWFSAAVLIVSAAILVDTAIGWRRLATLADLTPILPSNAPRLSIIVPALNEAGTIEPALRSILVLDYPALEVVAIDDRSTDATGEILDRMKLEFPALQVLHVRELPAGWLGKNHALHLGASSAQGDYLLFTDADVHYERSTLARAIAFCEARGLDHLTVLPDMPMRTRFMQAVMLGSLIGLLALYRPWTARNSGRHGLGIGAFNLVRAAAFRAAGGHAALAMEVLDDIELGRLMGAKGPQDLVLGTGLVSVEMYRDALEMLGGIQKNVFTFLRYSAPMLVAATVATFALSVWPWVGIVMTEGATRWLNVAAATAAVAVHADVARRFRYPLSCLVFLPLNGALTILLFWQVAIATWARGGVVWRGTFYSLSELKRAKR